MRSNPLAVFPGGLGAGLDRRPRIAKPTSPFTSVVT